MSNAWDKRKLSIAKLKKSGNYVGLYLVDNGCVSSAFIRKPLSKLLSNDYRDIRIILNSLKMQLK